MRKLLFSLALIGSFGFYYSPSFGQDSGPGDPVLDGENRYRGVYCASNIDCEHPKFGTTAESTWTPDISFCP